MKRHGGAGSISGKQQQRIAQRKPGVSSISVAYET